MRHRRLWLIVAAAAIALAGAWIAVAPHLFAARRAFGVVPDPRFVRPGVPVVFAGLKVGRVDGVACRDSGAVVTLVLERQDLYLTRAHRVRRIQLGAIGNDAVEIVAPTHDAAALERSDTMSGLPPAPLPTADSALARELAALGWRNTTPAPCRPTSR